jgi:hypothetical protein
MLILKTFARMAPAQGYGIAQHIQQISGAVLQVEEGSLYTRPAEDVVEGLGGRGVETVGEQSRPSALRLQSRRSHFRWPASPSDSGWRGDDAIYRIISVRVEAQ